jgi:hypothetical protein
MSRGADLRQGPLGRDRSDCRGSRRSSERLDSVQLETARERAKSRRRTTGAEPRVSSFKAVSSRQGAPRPPAGPTALRSRRYDGRRPDSTSRLHFVGIATHLSRRTAATYHPERPPQGKMLAQRRANQREHQRAFLDAELRRDVPLKRQPTWGPCSHTPNRLKVQDDEGAETGPHYVSSVALRHSSNDASSNCVRAAHLVNAIGAPTPDL